MIIFPPQQTRGTLGYKALALHKSFISYGQPPLKLGRSMQVRKAALIAIIAMAALMLVMPIAPIARAYTAAPKPAQEVPYGPWLDAIEFYEESDEAAMLEKIDKGERHIWLWDIGTVEGIRRAEESPNIEYVKAYSGCFNLFLNPLPRIKIEIPGVGVVERFNPFGIREVREALNLYLDREYVVKEIFAGYGVPHYTIWPPVRPDYNRVYADMKLLENEYAYNPSEAWDRIYKALTDAGCTFKDGKWYDPDGNPIVIKFWIRKTPAQRNALGHYFATELEKLGFEVIRRECTGLEAWMFVYSAIDDWNIYTEGWAFTQPSPPTTTTCPTTCIAAHGLARSSSITTRALNSATWPRSS